MGLNGNGEVIMDRLLVIRYAFVAILVAQTGCMAKKDVTKKDINKYWFECCNPGINAAQKDMCKWLVEEKTNAFRDREGNIYQAVWTGCDEGKEPWRKWED